MRGKDTIGLVRMTTPRITPAYAGKSNAKEFACKDGRDHPRVCGEKWRNRAVVEVGKGSPPRMRGKAISGGQLMSYKGITPAYAGKSFT